MFQTLRTILKSCCNISFSYIFSFMVVIQRFIREVSSVNGVILVKETDPLTGNTTTRGWHIETGSRFTEEVEYHKDGIPPSFWREDILVVDGKEFVTETFTKSKTDKPVSWNDETAAEAVMSSVRAVGDHHECRTENFLDWLIPDDITDWSSFPYVMRSDPTSFEPYNYSEAAAANMEALDSYFSNMLESLYSGKDSIFGWQPAWFITSFTFFTFASLLFSAGFVGLFLNNRNFLLILLKAELMFLGLNLWFIGFAVYNANYTGYVYALLLFGLVAAESAIGLSLFLAFFFYKKTIMTDIFDYSPEEIKRFNRDKQREDYWHYLEGKRRRKYTELFL